MTEENIDIESVRRRLVKLDDGIIIITFEDNTFLELRKLWFCVNDKTHYTYVIEPKYHMTDEGLLIIKGIHSINDKPLFIKIDITKAITYTYKLINLHAVTRRYNLTTYYKYSLHKTFKY